MPRRGRKPPGYMGPFTGPTAEVARQGRICYRCGVAEGLQQPPGAKIAFCAECYPNVIDLWRRILAQSGSRRSRYQREYGLDLEKYGRLFERQGGMCAICRCTDRELVVDHIHDTGRVRGLLCPQCNSAIGLLQDDPEVIARASDYVARMKQGARIVGAV